MKDWRYHYTKLDMINIDQIDRISSYSIVLGCFSLYKYYWRPHKKRSMIMYIYVLNDISIESESTIPTP